MKGKGAEKYKDKIKVVIKNVVVVNPVLYLKESVKKEVQIPATIHIY